MMEGASTEEIGNGFSEVDLRDADEKSDGVDPADGPADSTGPDGPSDEAATQPVDRAVRKPQNLVLDEPVPAGESPSETFSRLRMEVTRNTITGKELVNAILYVLVRGRFDMENAFIIREGCHVQEMVTLLDDCSPHLQAEVWSVFIGIVRKSNRNLQVCLQNDLIRLVLDRLSAANDVVADLFVELLTVLTGYSVGVKDMNAILRYLRASNGHWPCHSTKLLQVVRQMMRKEGPDIFFSLMGRPDSGIHVPPLSKWPYQNGWSFVTWLRLDPQSTGSFEEDVPNLFSFRTRSGLGYGCHFVGGCMVLTVHKAKSAQPLQQCIKHEFQLRKWYHVALSYSFSRWGRSEVHCYINGLLACTIEMNWHVNTNELFDRCFVGCSPGGNAKNSFSGQLSALYLFSETLGLPQVNSLYNLGPNYQSCFKFKNEVDLPPPFQKYLFDGKLTNALVFAYCPKNCDRQVCLNSAAKESQSHFRQTKHAVMMDGVSVVVTHSILTSLHSVGGVQVLLPLLSQLDLPVQQLDGSSRVDLSISSVLLSIFSQLLQSCPDIQLQMLQNNAFLVIGVCLTAVNKAHVTEDVLRTFMEISRFLVIPSNVNTALLRQMFDFILFNPDLWINTDGRLQTQLYAYLATEFFDNVVLINSVRRMTMVVQILHSLKFYYWSTDPRSRSGIDAKGKDSPRPTADQVIAIRTYLLTFLFKIMVKEEPGAQAAEELDTVLNFLTTVHEDDNVVDVLQTLIRLMSENPAALVPTFDKKRGVCVVFKLIGSESETIRLLALKLLGHFLCRCTPKRKEEAMGRHNLYTLLIDRLLLHTTYLNMRTYNVLFEILTEEMTLNIFDGRHKDPGVKCTFENPLLIKAIASLLHQSEENEETMEVKKVFLTDLISICNQSKENRRCILQMSVWQDWLISLTSLYPSTQQANDILRLVYQLFSILLHHAIKVEYGGWRVWIDTMAIIHSKASFEQFRQEVASKTSGDSYAQFRPEGWTPSCDVEENVYYLVQDLIGQVESALEPPESRRIFNINQPGQALFRQTGATVESSPPLYRIPEFRWSSSHLTLLSDLLLAIETDIATWKSAGSRSLIDTINMSENAIFVVNSIHVMSQSLDNFVVACGGLLPLLAALTSPNTDLEIVDTTGQGLRVNAAISFLVRLANLADVIIFGTACNFADLEHEKNMPSGGIMRQVLRLVTTVAVRNCLVARYKNSLDKELIVSIKERAIKALVDDLASVEDLGNDFLNLKPSIQDPDRLLQEVDVYRLKAAVYRDIEESRHSQFLALATIYFISVLMVSRYRDILEPPSSPSPFHNTGTAGSNWDQLDKGRPDSRTLVTNNHNAMVLESDHSASSATTAEDGQDKGNATKRRGDESAEANGFDDLTDSISDGFRSAAVDSSPSDKLDSAAPAAGGDPKASLNRERQALLTARLRTALEPVAPLFREIVTDFQSYFQKTLLGTHGQEIMNDVKVLNTLRNPSVSVVELVMLLCSQEWQTSLQKHAGLAFIELVNEGRLLAHATRDHLVRVANEAEHILNRIRAEDVMKHAEFEKLCAQAVVVCKEEENTCNMLILASRRRNAIMSKRILQKIVNILHSDCGAWGGLENSRQFWTLDLWEDDSRRRKRLVPNPYGSSHPGATLKTVSADGQYSDKEAEKARETLASYLRGKNLSLPASTPSSAADELIAESEVNMLVEEKEIDISQQQGASCFITACRLIAPGLSLPGILSISLSEIAFDVKEDDQEFKNADAQVVRYCEHLHGRWHTAEIRAIFLRRYLLQNRALEVFMSSRTAVMFAFSDQATVRKVVRYLPAVGVGVKYGIAQNRKASLMTPRQLFKQSDMSQKWQRREISNFDYLMFLNTVAGRTYNDLNQYPVFPWILSNYDGEELDLKQPANFRDLSKPIGALTESRRQYFIDRYNQWEHEKIPPFHYGTHYSTAAFALNWLIRLEPFTTLFLSMQGGKFDHADRLFHSISESWNRCLRDTHDVKELIPEFFYLPDMFLNVNEYKMGKREDGSLVGDVKLPPWAKSPEHFVTVHRQALESDLVSCQLHQWIDLIFGYKQRGPEAVRATNVFYYLTYEGVVNLSVFDDPTMKQAIENQIHNFGQTPAQLLSEPHTPRQSIMAISPLMFKSIPEDLCMVMKFISNSPVVHLSANTHPQLQNPIVVSVTASLCFALNRWNNCFVDCISSHLNPVCSEQTAASGPINLPLTVDPLLAAGNPATPVPRRVLSDSLDQHLTVKWNNFITTIDSKYIFVCGYPDHSFRLVETDGARIRQVIFGHKAVVTCLARSECSLMSDCFVASGSRDCTVLLWHWNAKQGMLINDQAQSSESVVPKAVLIGHDGDITCINVSAEHGLVLSSSIGGAFLIHTTQGELLRCLRPFGTDFKVPRILISSRECYAVVCYDRSNLCLFTTSGRLLKYVTMNGNITCMCLSRCGEYFITGSEEGVVAVYSVLELNCLHQYCTSDSAVKSVALTHNHRFVLAGLASGAIVIYNIDFNRWHHEYSQRYARAALG